MSAFGRGNWLSFRLPQAAGAIAATLVASLACAEDTPAAGPSRGRSRRGFARLG